MTSRWGPLASGGRSPSYQTRHAATRRHLTALPCGAVPGTMHTPTSAPRRNMAAPDQIIDGAAMPLVCD